MAEAFKFGVGYLLFEFFTDTDIFGRFLQTAGAVAAFFFQSLQYLFNIRRIRIVTDVFR